MAEHRFKEKEQREDNHIPKGDPILFLEIDIGYASEFSDEFCVRGVEVDGYRVLRERARPYPTRSRRFFSTCATPPARSHTLISAGAKAPLKYLSSAGSIALAGPDQPEDHARLMENIRFAEELGAKVVKLKDRRVADSLIDLARREGITHVVFGQSARSRWDILLRGSLINRFLSEVRDATVQVIPLGEEQDLG